MIADGLKTKYAIRANGLIKNMVYVGILLEVNRLKMLEKQIGVSNGHRTMNRTDSAKERIAIMKAWYVTDREGYSDYAIIVFAETRGKAIASAIGTDEFQKYEWHFTEMSARRKPALDGAYRGNWRMEWENDDDRLAMVQLGGYYCDEDVFDPDDCEKCVGKNYCSRYKEYLEEAEEEKA